MIQRTSKPLPKTCEECGLPIVFGTGKYRVIGVRRDDHAYPSAYVHTGICLVRWQSKTGGEVRDGEVRSV